MRVTSVQVTDYRNYESASFTPCEGVTALTGDNAQGKTNLLEAIVLCAAGRSHRTARDAELIRWGAETGQAKVVAERRDGAHDVRIVLRPGVRKAIFLGGKRCAKSGELMGHVSAVLFSPEDLRMVKDGPAERRRFVDMELSQMRPAYYYELQRYNRALTQRNALLRAVGENPALRDTVGAWDEQLVQSGCAILRDRADFIEKLSKIAGENHKEITDGAEGLEILYQPGAERDETAFRRALDASLSSDIRRGVTLVGPHRDDLSFLVGGRDARAYGSQGQQRTVALSLKLSELRVMRDEMGEWPALLLDDVMSELDPGRRRHLIRRLTQVQTFVTCTDMTDLAGADIGRAYRVTAGELVEI